MPGRRLDAHVVVLSEFRLETHEQAQPFPIHALGRGDFPGAVQGIQFLQRRTVVVSKPATRHFARGAQKRFQLRRAAAQRKTSPREPYSPLPR
jgi:hypothetical protein